MEAKGLEYSGYICKESLAQQGGYGIALKGPQHDEAWLIFMDMVNKQIPTFEDKAEALHYFPMWRTWFGLMGLCKLPWNDVEPEDNARKPEPNKVPAHVEGYENFLSGMLGKEYTIQDILLMSERVYNFQRVFAIRMGHGRREDDRGPYRAMGPVTAEEYESRAERYDGQLKELLEVDPAGKRTAEKMALLRQYHEEQYEGVLDAVYKRRGWTRNGTPTPETLARLGIDFPWVLSVVQARMAEESAS
jgi:aldehyde:ferredoxin oxidoreductase